MPQRIGILGGTFDPVHIGHLILASCARDQLGTDLFLLIPNSSSPLKAAEPVASFADRLAMLRLAVAGVEGFVVSDVEGQRGGISFTVDTLRALRIQYSQESFHLVMGKDALADFHLWKEREEVLRLASLVVVDRALDGPWPPDIPATHLEMPTIDVSSTMIRERCRENRRIDYLVLPSVSEYITAHKLYKT